ncbi:MAG: AI-2E family transporter [Caulobacteraceae bacterium]
MTDGEADRPGLDVLRNAVVFLAVVVALALVRFFHAILTPLVVATLLLLLIDAVTRVMRRRLPGSPEWVRAGLAGTAILTAFAAIGGLLAIEAPPFASELHGLAPKLDAVLARALTLVGAAPITLRQMFSGVDPAHLLARVFQAARSLVSYGVLVIIYFGFLLASRVAFGRKFDRLFLSERRRAGAHRVGASVRDAVERYVRLQTLKALMIAVVAFVLMVAMGIHDGLFIAFLVFLAAYVPIVGPVAGAIFPGLMALAQYDDPFHPILLVAVLGSAAFLIDNVLMPKLQSDELNIDPLLVLISIGFWGIILGGPGVLLSTPLTVTVMAIAAEFESTRWLAVLLSRDGRPPGREEAA